MSLCIISISLSPCASVWIRMHGGVYHVCVFSPCLSLPSLCPSLLLPDTGWSLSFRLTLLLAPPSGSSMSPELPRPLLQLSLGPEVRLSKYLAASRGFRVSREEDGLAGSGSPLLLGSHRHVMSCPLPQLDLRLHVPLSRLAMGGGGCCWL